MKQFGENNLKTILILSQENDYSTTNVIKWIEYLGGNFIRINGNDQLSLRTSIINNESISFNIVVHNSNIKIDLNKIYSFWSRRGRFNFTKVNYSDYLHSEHLNDAIEKFELFNNKENNRLELLFNYLLNQRKKTLGNYEKSINNKLIHHAIAAEVGIKIPESFLTNSRQELKSYLSNSNKKYVIKPISDGIDFTYIYNHEEYSYLLYTNEFSIDEVDSLPELFFPSLFQQKIEKKYEIRVFYLKGKCYSMAILSQADEKTRVDFRKYNMNKPNRCVRYELPEEIKSKIKEFMDRVELDTGSIDLIYSKNKEYLFLEVNPVGQFGMVSYPCNYYLEEEIAKELLYGQN